MKKTILKLGLFLLAVLLPTGCSSDKEPIVPCFCESNIINTVNDRLGVMKYNKQLDRWYILCRYHQLKEYYIEYYCPNNLEKQFRKEGLEVLFSGDLYEIKIEGQITTIVVREHEELNRYCIDLINIEQYQ